MEKSAPLQPTAEFPWKRVAVTGILLVGAVLYQVGLLDKPDWTIQSLLSQEHPELSLTCPQVPPLFPSSHARLDAQLDEIYLTDAFKLNAYELLGSAFGIS
ncbi:hypothetical protein MPER_03597 [Moniliophthora perniciosa FA553]|nr:hypothetical protein MPER_03597 [Moniliophthora perniciosa FA553]